MLRLCLVLYFVFAGFGIPSALAQTKQQEAGRGQALTVSGWIESVTFPDYGITVDAKLDTGASSSSIDVNDLERFKRDGNTWYRFTIADEGGKTVKVEMQTRRRAKIMRAEVEDTLRPIVKFKICLAGHVAETDFTLTDRSGQKLPVLIGRKFLADRILVDSNRMHIFSKRCETGK